MDTVFVVQHVHVLPQGEEDVKLIGVYKTREVALAAINRLRQVPGFRSYPNLVDSTSQGTSDGFYIDEYALDQDQWAEGFITT